MFVLFFRDEGRQKMLRENEQIVAFLLSLAFHVQGKLKHQSVGADGLDASSVKGHRVFHDRQAQSRTAHGPGASVVYPVEALEQVGQMFGGHTASVVPDAEPAACIGRDVQFRGTAEANGAQSP